MVVAAFTTAAFVAVNSAVFIVINSIITASTIGSSSLTTLEIRSSILPTHTTATIRTVTIPTAIILIATDMDMGPFIGAAFAMSGSVAVTSTIAAFAIPMGTAAFPAIGNPSYLSQGTSGYGIGYCFV